VYSQCLNKVRKNGNTNIAPYLLLFIGFGFCVEDSGEGVSAYEDSKKIDMLQYCCVFTRKSHFCDENVKIYKVPLYSIAFPLLRWHDKLK